MIVDSHHLGRQTLWIGLTAGVAVGWSFIISSLRVASKLKATGALGSDDYVLLVAQLFSVGQAVAVYVASLSGYDGVGDNGKEAFEGGLYAGQLLYVVCLYITKCSMVILFKHLSPDEKHQRACRNTLTFSSVWAFAAFLVLALRGNVQMPWTDLASTDLFWRWFAVEMFNILTELAIFGIMYHLIRDLNTKRSRRVIALSLCGARLLAIPVIAGRLYYLWSSGTYQIICSTIFEECILHWMIIAASIPVLRPVFDPYVMILADCDEQGKPIPPRIGFIHLTAPPEQMERHRIQAELKAEKAQARGQAWENGERPASRQLKRLWSPSSNGGKRQSTTSSSGTGVGVGISMPASSSSPTDIRQSDDRSSHSGRVGSTKRASEGVELDEIRQIPARHTSFV